MLHGPEAVRAYDRIRRAGIRSALHSLHPHGNATHDEWQDTFSPSSMPGLLGWWRADQGITIATGVSAWADLSGNGITLTQATGSAQPTRNVSDATMGGQSSLTFVAASSQALTNTSAVTYSQPDTIYAVAAFSSAGINSVIIDAASGGNRQLVGQGASNVYEMYAGTAVVSGGTTNTNPHAIAAVFNSASGGTLYVDSSVTAIASGGPGTLPLMSIAIGGIASEFMQGRIAEVIIYSGAHTQAQRASVFHYFGSRYGLATS